MASDWQLQCSSIGCNPGQRLPADAGAPSYRTSNDLSLVCSTTGSASGKLAAAQMSGLTVGISEDFRGLQISSALGKESSSFTYSAEERMQAIRRVFMEDESLQVSDGFQVLQIDSPFQSISEWIPSTPASSAPNEACEKLERQKEKVESAYSADSLQLPKPPQIGHKYSNSGTAVPNVLQEDAMTSKNVVNARKDTTRHHLGERERRKEINDLIGTLQSFLPQRISKMDKATVLSESLQYIKELQQKLTDLQVRKAEICGSSSKPKDHLKHHAKTTELHAKPCSGAALLHTHVSRDVSTEIASVHRRVQIDETLTADRGYFQKFSTNNISVNVSGDTAYFLLRCPREVLLEEIMRLLQKQLLDIVHLEISMKDCNFKELRIQAKATQGEVLLTNGFFVSLIQRSCLFVY